MFFRHATALRSNSYKRLFHINELIPYEIGASLLSRNTTSKDEVVRDQSESR